MANNPEISVERVSEYTDVFARQLGALLPALSEHADGLPVDEGTLRYIVESPDREQFAAFRAGELVGAATINLVVEPIRTYAILSAFITRPDARNIGVGEKLWMVVTDWCKHQEVALEFTSHWGREAAHSFYTRHGAKIRETTVFRWSDETN